MRGLLWQMVIQARKNNCLLSSIFPAGEGGFGQMMYPSPEWSPQDSRDGIFLHSAQASFSWPRVDQARLLRGEHILGLFGLYPSSLSKSGICFSIWESFIGFYICCYPISTILACLFSAGVRISWKKLCWMRACRRKWHLVSPTLYIVIVYKENTSWKVLAFGIYAGLVDVS